MRIMPDDDYWLNKLNVHLDQVEKQISLNKEQAFEQLAKKWDRRICDLIAQEIGLDGGAHNDQIDFITALVDVYPKESRQFIYLTEFAKRKRKEAVLSIAEEKLHPEKLQILELDRRKPSAKDILWLLFELFCQDPESLFDVYLKNTEKKHSTGTWFQTLFDGKSVNPGKLANMFEKESIENALATIDIPNAILCPKVIDHEDEKVLFLNAEIAAKTTKLRTSRNQGYTDDWIVARFDKRNNRVRISASSLDKGAKIIGGLIQAISKVECSLHEEDEKTPARNIKKFVKTLLKDKRDADTLIEIELDNTPIDGVGTRIRLKNDFSIAKPVSALSGQYGWLEKVNEMSRLLYLKLKREGKMFKLEFDWNDDSPLSAFVRWDDSHVDSNLQEEFKQYMQDTYEINICCKRRRFHSNGTD